MIKRTLYFGNPAYLSRRNQQVVVRLPEVEKNIDLPDGFKKDSVATIPIEDIGVMILDNPQIIISQGLLAALQDNNTAVISCDNSHMPNGLFMPLAGNTLQTERFKNQIDATLPLKKQLWQQTTQCKITNQASVLRTTGLPIENMLSWADSVKSGDNEGHEARAAAFYWGQIFRDYIPGFRRQREGAPPNNLLNYGYAILRAVVARSLVGSGLLPTLGIHHRNKYNAYCLADDIMEPYRPFVDLLVLSIVSDSPDDLELTKERKIHLLNLPTSDVILDGERSPLLISVQHTTASLAKCFEGTARRISYPLFPD